ncbi:MAG TPA: SpoIID/LytB domain-containing protein [Nocardioides sp.]|nr:SpoIID/LytB domain-containing protein [Nocardioides sp.]
MIRRLAVLLAAAALVAPTAPAHAADEAWDVPATARITVEGKGFGHGRGMSQYGAQHAATLGVGHRDIVSYYYPGTTWGTASGAIRVWISNDLTNDVQVAARSGLRAKRVGGTVSWNLAKAQPRAKRWRINPAGDSASVLEYLYRGWHQFRRVRGSLEFAAGGPIRLYTASGPVDYRGTLRSVPSSTGNRITVNVLPLETYLRGVLPKEVIASAWEQEALRAQAVAARTYAARQRVVRAAKVFDVCDTDACQVYGGVSAEYPTTDTALRATAGDILTYDGAPAFTEFTASSGGWTVAGDAPYLTAMPDKWDSPSDPNHQWRVDFTDAELERTWPTVGDLQRIAVAGRDGNGEWGGRVGTVTLTGSSGEVTVSATQFRQALRLRSTWLNFTVS